MVDCKKLTPKPNNSDKYLYHSNFSGYLRGSGRFPNLPQGQLPGVVDAGHVSDAQPPGHPTLGRQSQSSQSRDFEPTEGQPPSEHPPCPGYVY